MVRSGRLLVAPMLLVLGFCAGGTGARAQSVPPEARPGPGDSVTAAPPRLFLVEFALGPAWVTEKPPQEQMHFREHSENLRRLRDEGRLVLGARYSDKGIVVLKAANEAEARAAVERDESVKTGVFRFQVFDFRPFYDGCVEKPGVH